MSNEDFNGKHCNSYWGPVANMTVKSILRVIYWVLLRHCALCFLCKISLMRELLLLPWFVSTKATGRINLLWTHTLAIARPHKKHTEKMFLLCSSWHYTKKKKNLPVMDSKKFWCFIIYNLKSYYQVIFFHLLNCQFRTEIFCFILSIWSYRFNT